MNRSKAGNSIATIGVISDTHGLLRPESVSALQGADRILHAGDIGKPSVLSELKKIAPVTAIKGNIDREDWARLLSDRRKVRIGGHRFYLIHNVHDLDFDPAKDKTRVVVSGHSHKPSIIEKDGVLYLNPGSAGPRRFKLPVAIGKVFVDGLNIRAEIVELAV